MNTLALVYSPQTILVWRMAKYRPGEVVSVFGADTPEASSGADGHSIAVSRLVIGLMRGVLSECEGGEADAQHCLVAQSILSPWTLQRKIRLGPKRAAQFDALVCWTERAMDRVRRVSIEPICLSMNVWNGAYTEHLLVDCIENVPTLKQSTKTNDYVQIMTSRARVVEDLLESRKKLVQGTGAEAMHAALEVVAKAGFCWHEMSNSSFDAKFDVLVRYLCSCVWQSFN